MMKVLGWDLMLIDRCSKRIDHWSSADALPAQRQELAEILGETPLLDVLIRLVQGLIGCPRHLGLHNGGMVLTRKPLPYYSPIQTSAGGYRQVQFDKDDVEALGLIKFDVLGLRMLAALSEAVQMHYDDTREWIDLEDLPPQDEATYDLICSGETMSLFQIESPGQMNLLSRTQPRCFRDLVIQVALFRPGPIQGGMVNPFLQRRAGLQEVEVLHPCLAPILRDTQGIIVFQEQVLEICHQFAGLSLEEADRFRTLMSKWRDPGNMDAMGAQFMEGAIQLHGVTRPVAQEVFRQVAAFVGYGFCRSHAAAFARTVYQSAYLKRHYPAAYMSAVMQHLPGFFPKNTVLEEARRLKVKLLPVCILRSGVKYHLEQGAIRLPFTQVKEISQEGAERLLAWRKQADLTDLGESFWDNLLESVPLELPQWESLARAGAFAALVPRREALWRVGLRPGGTALARASAGDRQQLLLANQPYAPMSADFGFSAERARRSYRRLDPASGAPVEVHSSPRLLSAPRDIPQLAPISRDLQLSWDFSTQSVSAEAHPMSRHRQRLDALGVTPLARLKEMPPNLTQVKAAGWVLVRQRPPTAKGMVFVMIEDETDRIQVAVPPPQWERWQKTLVRCQALLVVGRLEGPPQSAESLGRYRSIMLDQVFDLEEKLGQPLLARDDLGLEAR
jgi:error-prone DNA polymerase